MRRTNYVALCLPFFLSTATTAETIYDTLNHPVKGAWFTERPGDLAAQPFVLGEHDTITSVTVGMGRRGTPGGTLYVDIYDDGAGAPGAQIGRLGFIDSNTVAVGGDDYLFDEAVSGLDPNGTYYVVVSHDGFTFNNGNRVSWGGTDRRDLSGAGEAIVKTSLNDWHTIRNHPEGGPPFAVYGLASVDAIMAIEGDTNLDGVLSASDIDALTTAIINNASDLRYDLNDDGNVDSTDHAHWVQELKNTWFGDASLDGEFSSEDMVVVFQAGKYELDIDAGWAEGDWTGDKRFGSEDLVAAFQDGGYELGTRAAVSAVPEPSCAILLGIGMIGLCRLRTRR